MNAILLNHAVNLNQFGAEQFNRGETLEAISTFKQALLCCSINAAEFQRTNDVLDQLVVLNDGISFPSQRRSWPVYLTDIFARPLVINAVSLRHTLLSGADNDSVILTMRATVLVNLALSAQSASEEFGREVWSEEALLLYQAAVEHLYSIDVSINAVLLAMYTLHNLALIYYERIEYAACHGCLRRLLNVCLYGLKEFPTLFDNPQYCDKILSTLFFLSKPPTTAPSA